jgi:hypothetical protein
MTDSQSTYHTPVGPTARFCGWISKPYSNWRRRIAEQREADRREAIRSSKPNAESALMVRLPDWVEAKTYLIDDERTCHWRLQLRCNKCQQNLVDGGFNLGYVLVGYGRQAIREHPAQCTAPTQESAP